MRLKRARISNYRVHRLLEVEFDPGYTLIAGHNEAGKSTLVEALHRAITLHYRRGGEQLNSMKSRFGGNPEVELWFGAAGRDWRLRKLFRGSSGSVCELHDLTGGRQLQADEAEARLSELTGVTPARSEKELQAAFDHLWIWQGSAEQDALEGAGASALYAALDRRAEQGGVATLTDRDRRLLAQVERLVAATFSSRGEFLKASEAGQAAARAADALQAWRAAQERLARHEREHLRLVAVRGELEQVRAALEAQELQVVAVDGRCAALVEALQGLSGLRIEQERAKDSLRLLADEAERRRVLAEAQVALRARRRVVEAEAHRAAEAVRALQARLGVEERSAQESEGRRERLEAQLLLAERREAALALAQQAEAARARQSAFTAGLAEVRACELALAGLPPVDAAALARLRQLHAQARSAADRLEAVAARLERLSGASELLVDGRPLASGERRRIDRPARLRWADGSELEIQPGGEELPLLRDKAADSNRALETALADQGVRDLEQAERLQVEVQLARQRLELAQKAQQARSDPALELAQMEARAAELAALVLAAERGLQELATSAAATTAAASGGDALALARALAELRTEQRGFQERAQALRLELDGQRAAQAQGERDLAALSAEQQGLEQRVQEGLLSHGDDGALEIARGRVAAEIERLAARRQALQANEQELEDARGQAVTLRSALAGLVNRQRQLERERDLLEGALSRDGDLDPWAEAERLGADHERAAAAARAAEQRARADQLLLAALDAERLQQQARREKPFLDACEAYLRQAFGLGARLALADQDAGRRLGLVDRSSLGLEAFEFKDLSYGARELVGLAVRLAMAEVLAQAEPDGSVPLVLDDATNHIDPERSEQVGYMIGRAVQRGVQVVLCSSATDALARFKAAKVLKIERPSPVPSSSSQAQQPSGPAEA
jgi:DNA repair exonuclease SbcCD ATPase subunit